MKRERSGPALAKSASCLWAGVLCLAFLAVPGALAAGEPITVGETVKIQSKILGEERTLLVSTPANYAQSSERYPVLYMTDGDSHILHTRGTVDFLARNGLMPDCIIVGVTNTNRTRDLSPTHWDPVREDGTREELPASGGAPKFLDFFAQELFPYVESHYRTAPYRIFAGHSLGGLLALHVFAARNEMFNAYIAASPALRWDDDYPLRAVSAFLKNMIVSRYGIRPEKVTVAYNAADPAAVETPPSRSRAGGKTVLFLGRIKLKYLAIITFLITSVFDFSVNTGGKIAHIGGALMGLAYGYGLRNGTDIGAWLNKILDFFVTLFKPGRKLKVTYRKPKTDTVFAKTKTDYDYNKVKAERQKAIDHILDKISKGGYDSLTREEKEILFNESQKKG